MSDPAAEELLALETDELEAAVRDLVARGVEAAPVLLRASELASDKSTRKLIRRGLHRLRSEGLDVDVPREAERKSVLRPVEVAGDAAFLGRIDARGRRLALLIAMSRGGGHILQCLLSDREGILGAELLSGKRRDARRFARDLRSRADGPREQEADAVRALVRRLHSGRPAPEGIDPGALAEVLAGPDVPTPGDRAREALAPGDLDAHQADEPLVAREEDEQLAGWLVEGDAVSALADAFDEVEQSPLVLSDLQRRERVERLLTDRSEEVFDAECRERLACRLEETAALWQAAGDEEGALAAVYVARQVRAPEPPDRVPLLRRVLERSLEAARASRGPDEGGGPVEPG